MKRIKLLTIILFTIFLTSCSLFDYSQVNNSVKPELLSSPINGQWEVEEILNSAGRHKFEISEKFYFDIDLFANEKEIFLSPNYEVSKIKWIHAKQKFEGIESLNYQNIENDRIFSSIEISTGGYTICDLLILNRNEIIVSVNGQTLRLLRKTDRLSKEEKNELRLKYSETEKVYLSSDNWVVGIGLRLSKLTENEPNNYDYITLILKNQSGKMDAVPRRDLYISNGNSIDRYNVRTEIIDEQIVDKIYRNDIPVEFSYSNSLNNSNRFRINFLSEEYITVENINNGELNTLSTFRNDGTETLKQLSVDDIVDNGSNLVFENINQSNKDVNYLDSIYNIGIYRDNAYHVLKGRIPILSIDGLINKDYTIKRNFNYELQGRNRFDLTKLKQAYPDLVDDFYEPSVKYTIAIIKDSLIVFTRLEGSQSLDKVYEYRFGDEIKNNGVYHISNSWINQNELEQMERVK